MNIGIVELTDELAAMHKVSKAQARKWIDTVIFGIADSLASGKKVRISEFGTLIVKPVKERNYRDPRNGEVRKLAASKRIAFTESASLKKTMN